MAKKHVGTKPLAAGSAGREWSSGRMSALLLRAREGDVATQFKLAQIYESGHGVAIDDGEAARWYGLAAAGGHVLAQFYLGQMYANGQGSGGASSVAGAGQAGKGEGEGEAATGHGVVRDYRLAYVWWSRAAAQGHEGAVAGLRSLVRVMSVAELTEARGRFG